MLMEIKTSRMILRPWEMSDADWLYFYAKDDEIGPLAGWPRHTSVENSKERIYRFLMRNEYYALYSIKEKHIIGSLALSIGKDSTLALEDNEAEIGYWLGRPFWGQGYMHEAIVGLLKHAFEDLKLERIYASHNGENVRSENVLNRLGFELQSVKYHVYNTLLNEAFNMKVSTLDKDKFYELLKAY